jgi:uncharacterized protein YndB with AHSA1/START domain
MNHQEIVAFLSENFDVEPWWQQMVTVTYEQVRGLRKKHEKPDGYEINSSKTINASVTDVFEAWENKNKRQKWLSNPNFKIWKFIPEKSMRITWVDGKTSVELNYYSKGDEKTRVTVQHSKLSDTKTAENMKYYWGENLKKLKIFLEG